MKKIRKQTTLRDNIGKLLLDLGKLIFASIFLGSSLRSDLPQGILTIIGFATAVMFFFIGVFLETKEKKTEETAVKRRKRRRKWN